MKKIPIFLMLLLLTTLFFSCSSDDDIYVTDLKIEGVSKDALTIDSEYKINVLLYPYNAIDKAKYTYKYTSTNTNVATVNDGGIITPLSKGSTEIEVIAINNTQLSKKMSVTVVGKGENTGLIGLIELSDELTNGFNIILGHSENIEQYISVKPNNDKSSLVYSSSKPDIATISNDGTIINALKLGETSISITSLENPELSAVFEVSVVDAVMDNEVTQIELAEDIKNGIKLLTGKQFNLKSKLITNLSDLSNSALKYESSDTDVVLVTSSGLLLSLEKGSATITITSATDNTVTKSVEVTVLETNIEYFDRTDWLVETSHKTIVDNNAAVGGDKENIIDESLISCLILGKPGKENVPLDDDIHFTIKMPEKKKFDVIKYTHRTNLTLNSLRIHTASILGSNDNVNFTEIADADLLISGNVVVIDLGKEFEFQYVRVLATKWDLTSSNTVQCSDFQIGLKTETNLF